MPRYATRATPRVDLGLAFTEYQINREDMIGARVLPTLSVGKKTATFPKIQRESLTRAEDLFRSSGSGYNRSTFSAEDDTYNCKEYGKEVPLDHGDREFFRDDFDAERASMQLAVDSIIRRYEIAVAAAVFNTSTWTGATLYTDNSGSPWDTTTTDVMTQINAAKEKVRTLTGMVPNALVISHTTLLRLTNNDDFIARIMYTERAGQRAMESALADIMGLDYIYAGKGVYNSADEGLTYSGSNIWSDLYAMLMVVPKTTSIVEPCVGRTFTWLPEGFQAASSAAGVEPIYKAESYEDDSINSTVYRVAQYVDPVIIDPSYGHLMKIDS